jgi:Pectate lyase superfamily protein/SMP-30/Gluconolactonase/LRE-like region
MPMWRTLSFCLGWLVAGAPAPAASFYPERLDDSRAVYLTARDFAVHADGVTDDAAPVQAAINRVQETTRKGIVFIPEGRYRLGKTIYVWNGIRLIGYGAERPVFVLGPETPGFQTGDGRYLVHFVSDRPAQGQPIRDANPGTFYSGMSNIDLEIDEGNPAAIGVRFHVAQHCFLAHMDFRLGSGLAGIEEIGNECEDLHFFGGEYGIRNHKPSPSWPFLLIDSSFEGQRKAAVETEEGGLTLVRVQFRRLPTAICVRENRSEELWMKDSRLEDIIGPAIVISDEKSARTQINLQNVICERVPVLAHFRESGRDVAGGSALYQVKEFSHGLHIADLGHPPEISTTCETTTLDFAPPPVPSDIPDLPPRNTWVNLRALGAQGDGAADDTAILQAAIARHRAIYLPTGRYRVADTIALKPDTVLIGLDPITTQLVLPDHAPAFLGADATVPAPPPSFGGPDQWRHNRPPFQGLGPPKALLETPKGGRNIVTGIGLDTGMNNRAVAAKWMSGKDSLMNDVRFIGGHGSYTADGSAVPVYNSNRTGPADPRQRWDSQYWSLWITDGGGGTFKDIWTPNTFAQAGVYISDTATEGRIYAMSIEHHVRNELILRNVSNWRIYALQTEEERGESPHALPVEIDGSSDITFANVFLYRVDTDVPFPHAVKVTRSHNLHFRGVHVYSPGKLSFDNTFFDQTHGACIRSREIAWLDLSGTAPAPPPPHTFAVIAPGAELEKVADGFTNIDGAAVDATGNVYFIDAAWQSIYRWSPVARDIRLVCDSPLQPVGLAFDQAGNLLVVSRTGQVYTFRPDSRGDEIQVIEPVTAIQRLGLVPVLPANRWRDAHDFVAVNTRAEPFHYLSPDGATFLPASEAFKDLGQPGRPWWLSGTVDLIRAYQLVPAAPGLPFYVADEFGQKTWRFTVKPDGPLADPQLLAEEGEAGVAVDAQGNVYVAAGQIFVYDSTGRQIDLIEVPERPSALVFGGADRRTLFIAARSSLYALHLRFAGR